MSHRALSKKKWVIQAYLYQCFCSSSKTQNAMYANEQNRIYEQITVVPEMHFAKKFNRYCIYLTCPNECSMNHRWTERYKSDCDYFRKCFIRIHPTELIFRQSDLETFLFALYTLLLEPIHFYTSLLTPIKYLWAFTGNVSSTTNSSMSTCFSPLFKFESIKLKWTLLVLKSQVDPSVHSIINLIIWYLCWVTWARQMYLKASYG